MMRYIKYFVFASLFLATACDVDRIPETQLSDESFWRSESDLKAAANYLYIFLPSQPFTDDNWSDDGFGSENNAISSGSRQATSTDFDYNYPYQLIRAANNIIEKAPKAASNGVAVSTVDSYIGEARYFRAWGYYRLVQRYGDVPLILNTLSDNDPMLTAPASSRELVYDAIYQDLDFAIAKLSTPSVLGDAGYGRISKTAALSFKARIALFEGTRSKFHNYGDYKKHLNLAVAAAKAVIDSKEHSLFPDYYELFRYPGEGRKNPENIMVHQYGINLTQSVDAHNAPRQIINGAINPTKVLVDAYLMKDGLPIDQSPLYKKPKTSLEVFNNRDARLSASVMKKGDPYSITGNYVNPSLYYQPTGYCFRKYVIIEDMPSSLSYIDLPIIRYAEVLLTYAEAKYELDGNISDGDLDQTINLLRTRGKVVPLTNSFVKTNNLNMRDEIRRERRVELAMEGFRYWDLIRWKTAETELPKPVLGTYYFKAEFDATGEVINPNLTADNCFIAESASVRSFNPKRDYLWPFPVNELALNPSLKQNPEW
ncbi:RagB/SusD family nutrient uptake outer membrane protein [Dyadobacter frigoris]|uniref:RagB/SusD family nutrient uptake outer membrane protein n=1 Tax=Dyadobacter frigoris TaxID=2576211 RepID=A0A4U6D4J0_9BACT|nr:RagB/SusD family nutrient uptake outer membrane protein [Dyadobacter frigoris]TKT92220.1 RagB/SusD family nutrient uptake outer membrane protein [Dyadobacter frigoris]GLU53395.1 hypothetical protein Dfri01_28560 [Dyadobacter frigoris]